MLHEVVQRNRAFPCVEAGKPEMPEPHGVVECC